jgi:hypothetical protein
MALDLDLFAHPLVWIRKEDATSLLCGHSYHTVCIETYVAARNLSISTTPCPQCKVRGCDVTGGDGTGPEVVYMAPVRPPTGMLGPDEEVQLIEDDIGHDVAGGDVIEPVAHGDFGGEGVDLNHRTNIAHE